MLTIHLENNERNFGSEYLTRNKLERREKGMWHLGAFCTLAVADKKKNKLSWDIFFPTKLYNMNMQCTICSYIHQAVINCPLKMLILNIWGKREVGGRKKLWRPHHFCTFIILDYCFRFHTANNRPEAILSCTTNLLSLLAFHISSTEVLGCFQCCFHTNGLCKKILPRATP